MLGNSESILFWQDRWIAECSLQSLFPELFVIVLHPNSTVAENFQEGICIIQFRRQLTSQLVDKYYSLIDYLAQ